MSKTATHSTNGVRIVQLDPKEWTDVCGFEQRPGHGRCAWRGKYRVLGDVRCLPHAEQTARAS